MLEVPEISGHGGVKKLSYCAVTRERDGPWARAFLDRIERTLHRIVRPAKPGHKATRQEK